MNTTEEMLKAHAESHQPAKREGSCPSLKWLLNELYHGNEFSKEQLWRWLNALT